MTLAQALERETRRIHVLRDFHADIEADPFNNHQRIMALANVAACASRMRRDIGLIGRLTEQELFDRRRYVRPSPQPHTL